MPFKSLFASTVLLLVGNIFCSPVFEQDSFADSKYFEALDVGRQLKPVQVSSLERHLADDPKDLEKRTKLIGYYFYQSEDRLARRKRGEHVLWFIKNAPEAAVLGWWQVGLDYRMNADLFGQAEDAWSWHLENDPDNLEVLWNASKFYMDTNWERSTALLEHAQSLDKTNPSWAEELGLLHLMNSLDLVGERDPEAASRALFHYEPCLCRVGRVASRLSSPSSCNDCLLCGSVWDSSTVCRIHARWTSTGLERRKPNSLWQPHTGTNRVS